MFWLAYYYIHFADKETMSGYQAKCSRPLNLSLQSPDSNPGWVQPCQMPLGRETFGSNVGQVQILLKSQDWTLVITSAERKLSNRQKAWEIKEAGLGHLFHINILEITAFSLENASNSLDMWHIMHVFSIKWMWTKSPVYTVLVVGKLRFLEIEGQLTSCWARSDSVLCTHCPRVVESAQSFGPVSFPVDTMCFGSWTLRNHFHHYTVHGSGEGLL